jgi:acetylornithine deacetylase/succinyl-diaminopimelate desuccinylase-like protein
VTFRLEDVYAKIDGESDETVRRLQTLCRQPSVSAQGLGLEEAAELVRSMMEEIGLQAELVPLREGPPVVYGRLRSRSSERTLLFYNHYDVQPPEPLELWESDPWAAEIRDGKIYARGAADNKANIASRLAAIRAYLETHQDVPVNITFVVEGEEEIGSPHFAEFIRGHRDRLGGEGAIWEFGGLDYDDIPGIILGLKGMLYVELHAQTLGRDVHSSYAAVAENPAWRLVQALNTLRDADGRITIGGWYDEVRPFTPEEIEVLEREPLDEEQIKRDFGISRFLRGMSGLELKKALAGEPTANIAGFWSGYTGKGHKTVLPAEAHAKMDFRLVPDQDPKKLVELLKDHLIKRGFADVALKIQAETPAARTPIDAEIVRVAAATAREVFGKEPNLHVSSGGSGPLYYFTNELGLPTVAIGCNHPYSNTHAPNENQRLDALISGTKWIAAVMERFGRSTPS